MHSQHWKLRVLTTQTAREVPMFNFLTSQFCCGYASKCLLSKDTHEIVMVIQIQHLQLTLLKFIHFNRRIITLQYCDNLLFKIASNMPANLENSAVATGLEKVSFHSNPKERQCQRMLKLLHNCTHLTR